MFLIVKNAIATKAAHEICAVYGENAIPERTVQWWFSHFKNGNFTLTDDECSGHPVKLDEDQLNNLLYENRHQSTGELGEQLGCDHKTVLNHLYSMEKVQKLGSWVSHSLSEKNNNNVQLSFTHTYYTVLQYGVLHIKLISNIKKIAK